jgi:mono/diheme cytochrome c family protein
MLNFPECISRLTARWPMLAASIALLALLGLPALADRQAYFTEQQVQQGKQVFNANCSQCHGSRLQGGAGPALKGKKFASSMEYANYDAAGLYDFISVHMPKTDPGGLSQTQYIEVFSYILSQNGFPSGGKPLDKNSLSGIKLLPLPGGSKG